MKPRIVLIGHFDADKVFALELAGVSRYAQARGWDVDTIDWNEARTGSPKALRSTPRPIGFIVEGSDMPPNLPLRLYGGAPVVFCNCTRAPRDARFARLLIDEVAVARVAFRELSASLPPACGVVGYWMGQRNWSDDRVAAFRAVAAEAGLPCHSFPFADSRKVDDSGELESLVAWLLSLPRHCAVFAVNDETAAVVAKAASAARLNIPRDLTLLGADNDTSICEASHPTLSSIQMDFESAGFLAASMLGETISHRATETQKNKNDNNPCKQSISENILCDSVSLCDKKSGPLLVVRRESTRGAGRREPRILEAVEVIRRKACDGLTVEALAARFSGSRRLFEMRFREAMGHSVLDEILHVRLEKVHTLLSRSDVPLSAIADFCGFNSDRALRKFFLSCEGMSMTEWRRLHGKGSVEG